MQKKAIEAENRFKKQIKSKIVRKLPMAWDKDFRTSVGEAKRPNVTTGYDDGAMNWIIDSFLRSICLLMVRVKVKIRETYKG